MMTSTENKRVGEGCREEVFRNWSMPKPLDIPVLMVNNSMSGGKVPFIPFEGNLVRWYGCGPTVYDSSHMGHARNYVTFDILRRIMEAYYGYDVNMVMNITDIDDKIIHRANEKGIPYNELARYWENDFWQCMRRLGCKLPDVITRVSEYVPEIIEFIKRIIANGYAYESNGSVYFDITKFKEGKHAYAKMEPTAVREDGGPGDDEHNDEKRCRHDFVLWKRAKENEPRWESPWGYGRPGWHIECSTMASDVLGFPIDIHSGGIDLRFPHHDNELAQSEAAYDKEQWVNYFLHAGHLHIHGQKMSKSEKNFITISEILKEYHPRVIRLLVLLHRWDQPMNYHPDGTSLIEPTKIDKSFVSFFGTLKNLIRKTTADLDSKQSFTDEDRHLYEMLNLCQNRIHRALCDNFDTPTCIEVLQEIVTNTNVYIDKGKELKGPLLIKIAAYVHKVLQIFGLVQNEHQICSYGLEEDSKNDERFNELVDVFGEFRRDVRKEVRALMKKNATENPSDVGKAVLQLCDEVRDSKLVALGIQLEDQGERGFRWKEIAKQTAN